MNKQKKNRNSLLALTGGAALFAIAVNVGITVVNSHRRNRKRKDLRGSNVRVNLSVPEILKLADSVIAKSKQVHDTVALVPLDKVLYTNVILPLADLEAQQFPLVQSCIFPKMVTTSEEVRKASAEAERRIDAHNLCCRQREDVYRVIKAFAARGEWVSLEAKRYTQFLIRDFERNGMNITLTKREELQRLKAQIDEQSMQYIQNLNDDTTFLLFSETELVGLPAEFLKSLDKDRSDKFKISMKSHHVSPVLELCKAGLTRRAVAIAYGRRCEANLPVLEKLVQLRHKSARLLGYSNYADFVVDPRMAKSSSKVLDLLEDISAGLTDSAIKELSVLKDLKKNEEGEVPFGIEDLPYYVKRVEEQFNLDFAAVKQYFPHSLVMSGIFKIYQDLFGLRFEEVTDAEVWHSDVQLFSVFDLGSSELLGYFYLDLYSREGKYGHTCVVALQNGSFMDGVRQIPLALLISQIQKEVIGHPGLLRFSEVVNLLHEFGHVVHHMCNRATFARFSGLRLDPDFVEIPAQVLENWCYESAALKLISGFHQDITMPIKDEICNSIKRWRCSFSALKLKQEILYCLFDQIIHSNENVDIVGLFKHLHPKLWAWERLSFARPSRVVARDAHQVDGLPDPPLGCRWRGDLSFANVSAHNTRAYRDQLTSLTEDQFTWQPYRDIVSPDYCRQGEAVWRTRAPLICFDRVEWHLPDRVCRQFGMLQSIPRACNTGSDLHRVDRRGRPNVDWRDRHRVEVGLWDSRLQTVVDEPLSDEVLTYTSPYMVWYHRITVLLVQHPRVFEESGYRSHATSYEGLVMLGLPMLEGTNPASCFPRTAIGYEAACYSHIWSEVFSADIFASKFRDDIFNQQAGMQFRNKVLALGGSKDPIEVLSDFLGREPSIQAFIDAKGCSS